MSIAPFGVDSNISGVLGQFMTWRDDTYATVARVLGCTPQTVGRKMRGERKWEAHEVALLAEHYEAPVDLFYKGPGELFSRTSRFFRHTLAA